MNILTSSSDKVVYDAGQQALAKKDFEVARQYFKRIIDGFPQSSHGPDARLALADSYFNETGSANYVLAVSGYRDFVTLYPQHPRSDYAQFKIAESYFKQRNTPDRDQTNTRHALEEFDRLLDLYPASEYVETARARIVACRQSLARGSFLVGYFYERGRHAYRAAITRYQGVMSEYPDYDSMDEVLYRLGDCLVLAGRAPEALPHLQKLLDDYPKSTFAPGARQLLTVVANAKAAPIPPSEAKNASPAAAAGGATPAPSPSPAASGAP